MPGERAGEEGRDRGDRALAAQLGHSTLGAAVPDDLGGLLIGHGPRPDRDRLGVALTLVRRTIALAPKPARGGPFAAAAWLSWALGRSTHAAIFADLALAMDADHGMSQIVATFVASCHIPAWAFVRP